MPQKNGSLSLAVVARSCLCHRMSFCSDAVRRHRRQRFETPWLSGHAETENHLIPSPSGSSSGTMAMLHPHSATEPNEFPIPSHKAGDGTGIMVLFRSYPAMEQEESLFRHQPATEQVEFTCSVIRDGTGGIYLFRHRPATEQVEFTCSVTGRRRNR